MRGFCGFIWLKVFGFDWAIGRGFGCGIATGFGAGLDSRCPITNPREESELDVGLGVETGVVSADSRGAAGAGAGAIFEPILFVLASKMLPSI